MGGLVPKARGEGGGSLNLTTHHIGGHLTWHLYFLAIFNLTRRDKSPSSESLSHLLASQQRENITYHWFYLSVSGFESAPIAALLIRCSQPPDYRPRPMLTSMLWWKPVLYRIVCRYHTHKVLQIYLMLASPVINFLVSSKISER